MEWNMAYKTLMLQLYRPSRRKCTWMDRALLRYSRALQMLLTRFEYQIDTLAESGAKISQRKLLALIDKKTGKDLNEFHVQPFKDSLKIEFASLAASYIEQKRKNPRARYPLAYLDPADYRAAVSRCIERFEKEETSRGKFKSDCSKVIERAGRLRSLYFGRYAVNRDYCLLYDKFKDRFYAKLYLLNSLDGYFSKTVTSSLSLRYVAKGMPAVSNQAGKKRYVIVPLAFGKRQYEDLKKALENPGLLHTARLTKKKGRYYLMVNMQCEPAPLLSTTSTMGVSRSPFGGLNYTVFDRGGKFLKHGRIAEQAAPNQILYSLCNRIVKTAWENRSQVILEANGGKNDQMPLQDDRCLSNGQYAALTGILKYKLPEKRLPPPVEVSANGLFFTCPRCANRTFRNRISSELFACIECGYASEAEWIGSENLAGRLIKYQRDKVPLTVTKQKDSLLFYNRTLGFECTLPQNVTDYQPMYDELSRYLRDLGGAFQNDPKKYAVWKKLCRSPDLRAAVRLILK
jgi:putative transposase